MMMDECPIGFRAERCLKHGEVPQRTPVALAEGPTGGAEVAYYLVGGLKRSA